MARIPNGRPPKAVASFKAAAEEMDVEKAVWSILESQRHDLGRGEVSSANLKLIQELVSLERARLQYAPKDVKQDEASTHSRLAELLAGIED